MSNSPKALHARFRTSDFSDATKAEVYGDRLSGPGNAKPGAWSRRAGKRSGEAPSYEWASGGYNVCDPRMAQISKAGATPDNRRWVASVLGIRNAPPALARRFVEQALVVVDH